jgi:predicted DCC family thiol-disulfide oxidoreductase YuxK
VAAQAPFSREDLDNEMHVRTPEGTWLKGFAAWQVLLLVLPRLAWLGHLANMPPVRWMGPYVYAFIAKHRYSLPGAPARCESDTCAIPGRPAK